jgi:C-terminal binding protein
MLTRYKVMVADFLRASDALETEKAALGDVAEITALAARAEDDLIGRIESADAIMLYHEIAISRKTLERLDRCRLIVRCGVGIDNVDWRFAREQGIAVANIPDYGTEEVADSAIGMALSLARGIYCLNNVTRQMASAWSYTHATPLRRLRGEVFGIVGLGRIGSAVAIRAKALGMNVSFYDPYRSPGYDKALGIRHVETLEQLLTESLILSLHCPLTDETRHMVHKRSIELMRPGAFLVNTARGDVVDTSAIPDAIASGRLAGAGIDVLADEPPAEDDALIRAWRDPSHAAYSRVIINPHAAFYSEQAFGEMRVKGADACRRVLLGLPVSNIVN